MINRFATGTAAATALVLSLTGCSGDIGTKGAGGSGNGTGGAGAAGTVSAVQVLERSSQQSGKADTVKMDLSIDATIAQRPTKTHMTGQLRFRPTLAESLTVDSGAGGQVQVVLVDDVLYMKSPAFQQLANGKPWVKLSLTELGSKSGINFDSVIKQAQQNNPADQTKLLTASKDVTKVGTETIDGVRTTHYTGTVNVQEGLGKFDAKTRDQFQQLYQKLGTDKIGFDVWVDGDSLTRKMINKVNTSQGQVNTTMLFSDYGKPVTITAPPAGEVGVMPSLGGAGQPRA
ncbi:LppX_LprAFG lipoprotein [Actinomadura scrupuli]|uniref:LppX_LprAFG lipoprotein n=1 Tax=Actinomadura scrupuli TaxID=559629 RepID=UPI003D993E7E